MSITLDELLLDVANNTTVTGSAIALLNGLHGQLTDLAAQLAVLGQDPTKIQAIADQLSASTQALADAVSVNTPVV